MIKPGQVALATAWAFIFLPKVVLGNTAEQNILLSQVGNIAAGPSIESYRQALRRTITIKEEYFPFEWDTFARYMPPAGASGQSGKVEVVDSASEFSYDVKAGGQLPVELALISECIGIDNTTAVQLPSHLTSLSFAAETTVPFFNVEKTFFTVGLAARYASDNWNTSSSSFRLPQRYFFIYQPNARWAFILGAEVKPDYDEVVSPIAGFIYKPNDKLTFNIVPKGPEITYNITDKLTIFGQGDMLANEYEVTQGEHKDVILKYHETHLGGGVRYKFNRHLSSHIACGSVFNRSFRYRHDSLGKVELKDGFYTEFRLTLDF